MTPIDREALQALLAQMQDVHQSLGEIHAGICVLHLEAAIAALESHLLRYGAPPFESQAPLHAGGAH